MTKLTLLHTNDLHGRIQQLARIGTLVRRIREEAQERGEACLYFDAGDCEDTVLVESALTHGSAMDAILRSAGCDETALGNAIPIRYGPQALENLSRNFGKPILCANLYWDTGSIPAGLAPYAIHQVGDLKLGVIGMTAPVDVYLIYKAKALPPEQIAAQVIKEVRGKGASLIVLLSHLGLKHDIKLAETIPGIDVIIGGHSHNRVSPPQVIKETQIVQAGEHGQVLGRLDLDVDPVSGKILKCSSELIPVEENIPEDEKVMETIQRERLRAQQLMNEKIGDTRVPIITTPDAECSAGNLLVDAVFEHIPDAQVGFIIGGHWESGLEAGPISLGGLNIALRSTGNPARVELTGSQIKQFLIHALKPENCAVRLHAFRGVQVGMPHIAGMRVSADRDHLENLEVFVNGNPIQEDARYIVATSDIELSEILNYLYIPDEEVQFDVPTILPEVVEEYIRKHTPIREIPGGRIHFNTSN